MSGILKGDSIYKSGGGGGGGYKDGGELVDGDIIKVDNNTISSYENESRDPVNFYFDVKDGEVINSIIEITTQINATVNIYVLKNGFYYLLSNVGGNTINASEKYKINVTGESFDIEKEDGGGVDPEFADIDGTAYPIKKIGGVYWMLSNLGLDKFNPYKNGSDYYYRERVTTNSGWRLPTYSECEALRNTYTVTQLKSTSGWNAPINNGTNESGFNFLPKGDFYYSTYTLNDVGYEAHFMYTDVYDGLQAFKIDNNWTYGESVDSFGRLTKGVSVRLVKPV